MFKKTEPLLLAAQLDRAFDLPRKNYANDLEMGFHIGGYESSDPECMPGISHVFINKNENQFVPEMTQLSLEPGTAFFLRNGMYEPFALMWNDLIAIDSKYKALIVEGYPALIDHQRHDPVDLHAEWIGGWVKQVCVTFKAAGMPEYVGKTVRVLTFNNAGDVRTYELPEFRRGACT